MKEVKQRRKIKRKSYGEPILLTLIFILSGLFFWYMNLSALAIISMGLAGMALVVLAMKRNEAAR